MKLLLFLLPSSFFKEKEPEYYEKLNPSYYDKTAPCGMADGLK